MGERGIENYPKIKKYSIDLSEAWDMESQIEIFFREIKKLPFYRPDLLYSGFDGDQIGKSFHSDVGKDIVFCVSEEEMGIRETDEDQNPMIYAMDYDNPAISAYDPLKLELAHSSPNEGYRIKDPGALVAVIVLK